MDQPYDEQSATLTDDDVAKAITIGSRQGRAGCFGYVELEDLIQTCWVDLLDKHNKYQRYINKGDFTGIVKEFTRTAGTFAQREKAVTLGYKPEDLFFYSKKTLREVIPAILESEVTGEFFEFEYPDRALWMDVQRALAELSAVDQQLLQWAFYGDPDAEAGYASIAKRLNISEVAASMRVSRVLDKIREFLGGENPVPRRRAVSNAASQAMTRNQWDGEG